MCPVQLYYVELKTNINKDCRPISDNKDAGKKHDGDFLGVMFFPLIFLCVCVYLLESDRCAQRNKAIKATLTFSNFLCFAAQNVTVEEILSSYKQACQKLNCKPIAKVLKQIQVRFNLTQALSVASLLGTPS